MVEVGIRSMGWRVEQVDGVGAIAMLEVFLDNLVHVLEGHDVCIVGCKDVGSCMPKG
jgi:hypothetical protein